MENETPLTIDPEPTRQNILADERTIWGWARLRKFSVSTVSRIVGGTYPHSDDPKSKYQGVLRALKKDGYLVESGARADQAAA